MSARDDYPGIAAIVDEWRALGMACRYRVTENGKTFKFRDKETDAIREAAERREAEIKRAARLITERADPPPRAAARSYPRRGR